MSAAAALTLTLLHEQGLLVASVTDGRHAARAGQVHVTEDELQQLRTAPSSDAPGLQSFGTRLFRDLLPAPVAALLSASPTRALQIQLNEPLLDLPWEAAFDGTGFLGRRFRVARRLVCDEMPVAVAAEPLPRDLLQVLLTSADVTADADALAARLRALGRIAPTVTAAGSLARSAAHDVLHWLGDDTALQAALAALPWSPRLLVAAQPASAATLRIAAARGVDLVSGCASSDLAGRIYRELADGIAGAEALRRARTDDTAALTCAQLYGDGEAVLASRLRRPQDDDSRRQITVLSFDLVDSTRLLGTLGAERYSDLLARYYERCEGILRRYGGLADDPRGDDGIMCWFGYPVAHEDSARQALRAGLELVGAVAQFGLQVRAAVCTGRVVIRDGLPYGDAIHLAARLQSVAAPGTLVASDSTRQLVKTGFDFRALDALPPLKGFDAPVTAYCVLGESLAEAADPLESAPRLTPFTGRAEELAWLQSAWLLACNGALTVAAVRGDAGIGKSRLVREFRRTLTERGAYAYECRCAPDRTASAFWPVIDFLRRLMGLAPGDSVERQLDLVERVVRFDTGVESAAPLLASLMSIPHESRWPPLAMPAERQRQQTLELLSALLRRQSGKAPTCLIVEDVQWIDPSTRAFLQHLAAGAGRAPLLLLLTQRIEDGAAAWPLEAPLRELELRGLSPEASRALVLGACGAQALPAEIVRLLAARADGVPLFIEESARMAAELVAARPAAARAGAGFEVPATIHDLLMARLDRMGAAKQVAQVGGAIGREFPHSLLAAVLAQHPVPLQAGDLASRLATLVGSGLLLERGDDERRSYAFKHALVRDAAYGSLLERERQRLHRVIALVIDQQFPDYAEQQPELVAHHHTEAGNDADAVASWERAARRAASRSAQHEAISHVTNALAILERLPHDTARDRDELKLQLLLASRLIATEGYGAARVEQVYARASELCQMLGDEAGLLKVQLGLEGVYFMRGSFDRAQDIARQAAAIAARSANPVHALQAAWAAANVQFHRGELAAAVAQMDSVLAGYERLQHRPGAVQDPGVMCLCYSAWGLWELGFPDQALHRAGKVVALAEGVDHKFSMGEAYGFRTTVHWFRGELAEALQWAERAVATCDEGGFAVWLAHARLMRGRLRVARGDAGGSDDLRAGFELWTAGGAVVTQPFYLALQAEALAQLGRHDDGLALLEQALQIIRRHGERYYEAEVRRLYGELLLQRAAAPDAAPTAAPDADVHAEAEGWFRSALDCAQRQQLHSLALRSALSLACLWQAQGRIDDALAVLQPELAWFTEGLGTADPRAARALVGQLQEERQQRAVR